MLYLVRMLDMLSGIFEGVEWRMFLFEMGLGLVVVVVVVVGAASVVAPAAVRAYSSSNSMIYK
jgi:hypothetical protein